MHGGQVGIALIFMTMEPLMVSMRLPAIDTDKEIRVIQEELNGLEVKCSGTQLRQQTSNTIHIIHIGFGVGGFQCTTPMIIQI